MAKKRIRTAAKRAVQKVLELPVTQRAGQRAKDVAEAVGARLPHPLMSLAGVDLTDKLVAKLRRIAQLPQAKVLRKDATSAPPGLREVSAPRTMGRKTVPTQAAARQSRGPKPKRGQKHR